MKYIFISSATVYNMVMQKQNISSEFKECGGAATLQLMKYNSVLN